MILKKLALINFKNYGELTLEFSPRINCFVGDNGVGKTNLLDAIYYLSMCKSYFNNVDQYNIHHNEEMFLIQGEYELPGGKTEDILCSYKKNGRKIVKRNKKEYEKLSEHIGLLPIVIITPYDSTLITDGSEERRKLIDTIISQYNPLYLEKLILYNKILQQRNRLLKDLSNNSGSSIFEIIDVYDSQLSQLGTFLFEERKKFINEFSPIFLKLYQYISDQKENASIEYQSQLHEQELLKLLKENFIKDKQLEYTTVGIHKDDLLLHIGGIPAKRIASQGQQKTFLVALKLAEYHFLHHHNQKKPLLLLDDIFDKFDHQRVLRIIELTNDAQLGQIFITDTEFARINLILKQVSNGHRVFKIENQQVRILNDI